MDVNSPEIVAQLNAMELLEKELGSLREPNREQRSGEQNLDSIEVKVEVETNEMESPSGEYYQPLHNRLEPSVHIKHEKPWHRLAIILKSAGMTDREIAAELDVTPSAVAVIWKQQWASEFLLKRLHSGGDKAMAKLHAEAEAAVDRLIALSKNAKNEETRRKSNEGILDRKYGRPNQPFSGNTKSAEELSDAELVNLIKTN